MGLTQKLGTVPLAVFTDSSNNVGIGGAANASFKLQVTGTTNVTGVLTLGSTISNGTYTYTLPSATGTLALTSALSGYLPLTGGTLTGALSGTSATFSGNLEVFSGSAGVTVGDFLVNPTTKYVYVGRQSSTSGDNTIFVVRDRTGSARATIPGGGSIDTVFSTNNSNFIVSNYSGNSLMTIANTGAATFSSSVGVGGSPTGTYGTLSVFGGISTKDDNNGKLEIGRYSSGAPNSYIKIGTNSGSLRITNAADTIDLVSFLNSGFTFFGAIPSVTNYIKYNFNVGTDQNIGFRSSASIARLEATNDAVNANVPMEFAASTFIFAGGNVGIGITPSSWDTSNVLALQIKGTALWTFGNGVASFMSSNIYYDGSVRRYIFSDFAVEYAQNAGNHIWYSNPSGTAGASFTPTERMRITSGGIVTTPFQPAFRAGRSTSYAPGSGTAIVFNDTSGFGFNIGSNYNTSNGRFTAPVDGVYNFNVCVIWESIGNGQLMDDAFEVKVNGVTAAYSFRRAAYVTNTTGIGGYYTDHATVLLKLSAGQYVQVFNRYAGLNVHGNSNYCYFTGYLVG